MVNIQFEKILSQLDELNFYINDEIESNKNDNEIFYESSYKLIKDLLKNYFIYPELYLYKYEIDQCYNKLTKDECSEYEKLQNLEHLSSIIKLIRTTIQRKGYEYYSAHLYTSKECKTNSWMNGRHAVYTCIIGGYDKLNQPEYIDENADYICFSDIKIENSGIWKIKNICNNDHLDNARLSRKYKILAYKYLNEYDYTIYIDGSIKIIGDINQYINRYSKGASMIGFPHYERDCIYEEAEICKKYKLDKPEIIDEQMSFYKSKGFPEHYGLNACGIMVRSNRDQTLNKVMDDWWYEVNTHSKRDQLSFNYVCWKNNYQFDLCDLYIDLNNYFVNMRTFYRKLNVITYKEISVDYLESNRYAIDEKLKELVKKGKKLAIWGCGEKCKKILKLFDFLKHAHFLIFLLFHLIH